MNAITEMHAFRAEAAREFAVSQAEHIMISAMMRAANARYEQARAYLTYIENIEYAIGRER